MLAAGCLMQANAGIGQQLQKQIGQTGIPVYNVANACATGATALRTAIMAVKSGECDMGLAVGVEKLAGAGLLGGGGRAEERQHHVDASAAATARSPPPTAASAPTRCPACSPRSAWSTATSTAAPASSCSPRSARRTTPTRRSTRLAAYSKRFTLDEIMNDMMIAYPNTRPMCSANCDGAAAAVVVSDAKLKTLSLEQQRRAIKISASVLTTDPWQEACQVLPDVNTLTRNAATIAYEKAGIGPEDLDLVELHDCFATAELVHYDNLMLCPPGGAVDFFESGAPWRDGIDPGQRVGRPAVARATRSPRPASPTSGRSATTCAARPATARSKAPRSASPTSSASARPAASTSWRSGRAERLRSVVWGLLNAGPRQWCGDQCSVGFA